MVAVARVEDEYGYDDEQEDGGAGDYDRGYATEGDHRELLQPGELAAGYEGAGGDWQAEGGGEEEGGADDQGGEWAEEGAEAAAGHSYKMKFTHKAKRKKNITARDQRPGCIVFIFG